MVPEITRPTSPPLSPKLLLTFKNYTKQLGNHLKMARGGPRDHQAYFPSSLPQAPKIIQNRWGTMKKWPGVVPEITRPTSSPLSPKPLKTIQKALRTGLHNEDMYSILKAVRLHAKTPHRLRKDSVKTSQRPHALAICRVQNSGGPCGAVTELFRCRCRRLGGSLYGVFATALRKVLENTK